MSVRSEKAIDTASTREPALTILTSRLRAIVLSLEENVCALWPLRRFLYSSELQLARHLAGAQSDQVNYALLRRQVLGVVDRVAPRRK